MNVAALPDKGERLKTQVKELEDALESLSLTAASQPGNSPTEQLQKYKKLFIYLFFLIDFPPSHCKKLV